MDVFAADGFVAAQRLVLASVFLMAGWLKIREGSSFAETVGKFGILPAPFVRPFAIVVPWIEVGAACALFAGAYITLATLALLILISSFIIASFVAIARKLNIACDCFGLLYRERIGRATVARDTILVFLALNVAVLDNGRLGLLKIATDWGDLGFVPGGAAAIATTVVGALSIILVARAGRSGAKERSGEESTWSEGWAQSHAAPGPS